MWIATGLAKIRSVDSGHQKLPVADDIGWRMFLSHRGKDSKRQLMEAVLKLNARAHIFLDCLSLPRKMVNRYFVFKSLVRSEKVLLVETANFSESAWCRKESSLANILVRHGICEVATVSHADSAIQELERHREKTMLDRADSFGKGALDSPTREAGSWTTTRILRDIDYHSRHPNLFSVKEMGLPATCFDHIMEWLGSGSQELENLPEVIVEDRGEAIVNHVRAMYQALLEQLSQGPSPRATDNYSHLFKAPIDLWATAAQFAVGAMSLGSNVYNKVETRRYIDATNVLTSEILKLVGETQEEGNVEERLVNCMVLMCASVALELAGEDYRYVAENNGILQLAEHVALLQDGLLLVDARPSNSQRQLLLRLLVLMVVHNGIGSIGLLQDSRDPVHETIIDGTNLAVMPCVTLHPGMESLFS
jgi:hypothetical protein